VGQVIFRKNVEKRLNAEAYIPQVRSEEIIKAEDTEDGKEWHQNSRLRI
jgi:hypothetical protein